MNALHQYQKVNAQTSIIDADPHRLIQLLINGALERINGAKAKLSAKDFEGKNRMINKATEIVASLRGFLNHEQGGEIAVQLEALYDYCERRLFEANVKNDVKMLDEVFDHLRKVKEGWDGIRPEVLEKKLV